MSSTNVNNEQEQSASKRVLIDRPVYSLDDFKRDYMLNDADENLHGGKKKTPALRLMSLLNPLNLLRIFTIQDLIVNYSFKRFFAGDLLSGITVGVMHIPAALAYGALTSLNPVHGIYTSFYTGLAYVLFGTSKHLSVGTFAVISLMVYSTIITLESELASTLEVEATAMRTTVNAENRTLGDMDTIPLNITALHDYEAKRQLLKVKIATSLAFFCGLFQVLFSFLRFGVVSKYLPQPLLRGFTTAAGFHVFTSQLKHVLGIYYVHKKNRKIFKLVFTYLRLIQNITNVNWVALLISGTGIAAILLIRIVNRKFQKQLRNLPIPIELIVIIAGTTLTHFAQLDKKCNINTIGEIPKGFPPFTLPEFSLFTYVIRDAIIISIVAFTVSISVSDLYARKYKYKIDPNREFFALGMANIVGSFFKCFVSSGSLARTAVLDKSGGKSQMVTIIASGIVLIVMIWLSPLLQSLPNACLGAIIVAAILGILQQMKDVIHYWKVDKLDCFTWVITFVSCILFDVDYGLVVGVLTVLFLNTYRSQNLELKVVGHIDKCEIYADVKKYNCSQYDSIKIVRPNHSIFYVNCDYFRQQLNVICPLKDSIDDRTMCEKCQANYPCLSGCGKKKKNKNSDLKHHDVDDDDEESRINQELNTTSKISVIILDCTNIQFIDEAGFKALKESINGYLNDGFKFFLTNCHEALIEFLRKMNFKYDNIYLTVQDAVEAINDS